MCHNSNEMLLFNFYQPWSASLLAIQWLLTIGSSHGMCSIPSQGQCPLSRLLASRMYILCSNTVEGSVAFIAADTIAGPSPHNFCARCSITGFVAAILKHSILSIVFLVIDPLLWCMQSLSIRLCCRHCYLFATCHVGKFATISPFVCADAVLVKLF